MKTKIIFSEWVAASLVAKGHTPLVRPDRKNPSMSVFIFLETKSFLEDLDAVLRGV